jgi:hypothetical protein
MTEQKTEQKEVVEAVVVDEPTVGVLAHRRASFFEMAAAKAPTLEAAVIQYGKALSTLKQVMLSLTGPQHWTIMGEGESEHAYLKQGGAQTLAQFVGARVSYSPVDADGNAAPARFNVDQRPGVFGYRIGVKAQSDRLGTEVEIVFERTSDEEFTGRKDVPRGAKKEEWSAAQAKDGDLRSAVLMGGTRKAIGTLTGCGTVALSELEAAWQGAGKKIAQISRGAGGGSKTDRNAAALATDDVKVEQELLFNALGRAVGGDEEAGKKLCRELTEWTDKASGKKNSFDVPTRLTRDFQFEQAWKRFEAHPTFGKACPTAAERETERGEIKVKMAGAAK